VISRQVMIVGPPETATDMSLMSGPYQPVIPSISTIPVLLCFVTGHIWYEDLLLAMSLAGCPNGVSRESLTARCDPARRISDSDCSTTYRQMWWGLVIPVRSVSRPKCPKEPRILCGVALCLKRLFPAAVEGLMYS
jgi:hypothetical protein